jgi:SAM-dependent methyltransferase
MTTHPQSSRQYQGNDEAIEAWDGVLYDKFTRFRHIVAEGLGVCGTAVLERHRPVEGARVLDIGCGFGDSTREIGAIVGPSGQAVGVDAAPRFVGAAEEEARAAGLGNTRFLIADVERDDLGGPYDYAFSRFGVMFFTNPVAAFRNVRRSLTDDAKLGVVVWRKKEDNAWVHDAERAVENIVPLPQTTDEATCGPGPFSMASPDLVSAQILAAGYSRPAFERFDTTIRIGADLPDAIDFAMSLGPAGEIMRLAGDEAKKREPEVIDALAEVLRKYATDDGVFAPASTWIVTAHAAR